MANVNSFEYIEKTLPGIVDSVFAASSFTDSLIGKNALKLDFLDARTVKVYRLASTGLYDYARGGHGADNKRGAAKTTTETFTLKQERYSEIPLDKLDTMNDGETVLGHLAEEFIRTKVVPEFDTYRFSTLAGLCSETMGNKVSEDIAANTIIAKFNAAFKWMAEQKVPESDQIIYVNPGVMELIRNTAELAKRLMPSDMSKNVKFSIEEYEGRPIVVVPSDEFYTDATVGDGIYPSSTSKTINFIVLAKSAPIIVKKLDHAKVYDSTGDNGSYLGYVGYLLTNLYYHDIFLPENKKPGVYCSVSTASATGNASALLIDAVAGTSGKTLIRGALTQPGGIMYDVVNVSTAATIPAIGSSYTATADVIGTEITPNASHNVFVAVLDGKVVAVSKDFGANLPKGA